MKQQIPQGYQHLMPYLIINNAGAFLKFMKDVFGATEKMMHMRDETKIMHAELQVGESTVMFADSTDKYKLQTGGFFIYVDDADETYRHALEKGCTSTMELTDMDYGRCGGVIDSFGNTWWITSVKPS